MTIPQISPLISIVTITYNSKKTVSDTINSVLKQTYPLIEYNIVDGASNDGTVELIRTFGDKISNFVTETDKGIYDAVNKGIKMSKGEIVGILNSDDFLYDNKVIENVADLFRNNEIDAIYGDIQFVDQRDTSKIIRYYSSKYFTPESFKFGIMPAHPSFYARKSLFELYGYYRTDYSIAADFELLLRFFYKHRINTMYIPRLFVSMRTGGISNRSISNRFLLNREIAKACRENGLKTNYLNIYSKYLTKVFEYINLKKKGED